jgi:16S rRNA (cytidine1402-2'-O)-methyltransferase
MARQRRDATGTQTGAKHSSTDESPADGPTVDERRPWGGGSKPGPGLYLVATPIGNLRDITLRALDVLAQADLIACEDTRVTGKLLRLLGIDGRLTPYHDHNADAARPGLLARLAEGAVVALVSDAGTPLVSDPGFKLVRDCVAAGHPVTALPGPSAALVGLQLSALPADRFLFAGFLPGRAVARRAAVQELAAVPATLIFFESPHRAAESLADMERVLGERPAALARELTKLHEEVVRGTLGELARRFAETPPRGEVVIIVAPPGAAELAAPDEIEQQLRAAFDATGSVRDASALVSAETGQPRRAVYATALRLFRTVNEE